jgi:hypothetical protein
MYKKLRESENEFYLLMGSGGHSGSALEDILS